MPTCFRCKIEMCILGGDNHICPNCQTTNKLCKCGCGNLCQDKYRRGCGRRGKQNSLYHNEAISNHNKGKKMPTHVKELLSSLNTGRTQSVETRAKKSKIAKQKGFGKWMQGRKLSQQTIKKMLSSRAGYRKGALKCAETMKNKRFFDTKPELRMKRILSRLKIQFKHPYPVWDIKHIYSADFFIPKTNTIVEVDGKHWHNLPHMIEKDQLRGEELKERGYKVVRFWEDELTTHNVAERLFA